MAREEYGDQSIVGSSHLVPRLECGELVHGCELPASSLEEDRGHNDRWGERT